MVISKGYLKSKNRAILVKITAKSSSSIDFLLLTKVFLNTFKNRCFLFKYTSIAALAASINFFAMAFSLFQAACPSFLIS